MIASGPDRLLVIADTLDGLALVGFLAVGALGAVVWAVAS